MDATRRYLIETLMSMVATRLDAAERRHMFGCFRITEDEAERMEAEIGLPGPGETAACVAAFVDHALATLPPERIEDFRGEGVSATVKLFLAYQDFAASYAGGGNTPES